MYIYGICIPSLAERVAEKYNRLLDKLLSIAELTEQQLKKNVEFEEEKMKMEMQFLLLELELKKEQ
jgi:hypothetical protein